MMTISTEYKSRKKETFAQIIVLVLLIICGGYSIIFIIPIIYSGLKQFYHVSLTGFVAFICSAAFWIYYLIEEKKREEILEEPLTSPNHFPLSFVSPPYYNFTPIMIVIKFGGTSVLDAEHIYKYDLTLC